MLLLIMFISISLSREETYISRQNTFICISLTFHSTFHSNFSIWMSDLDWHHWHTAGCQYGMNPYELLFE